MKKNASVRLGRLALGGLAVLVLLSSCIKDRHTIPGTDPEEGIATVTFRVRVPGANNATTRGLSLQQEMKVDQMDVLLFSADGSFSGRVTSEDIDQDGSDASLKTFTVDLPTGNWNIVMLANSKDVIDLVNPEVGKGLKKDVLTGKLVKELSVKWPADGSLLLPMWCDAGTVAVNKGVDLTDKGWKLTRMVASVGVTVAAADFSLTSVHVYNYNNAGRLIPDDDNWDGGAVYNGQNYNDNKGKVTGPTVAGTTVKGPLKDYTVKDGACMNEIYLFEFDNFVSSSVPKESDDRTCLVVGGKYKGSSTTYYYRMDFSKVENGDDVFLNVLRNHKYIFNITDVRAEGYTNPDDAFEAGISNIDVNVNDWDESELNLWIIGQYYFNISPLYVDYLGQARPNCELVIRTNYKMSTEPPLVSTKQNPEDHTGPGDVPGWITNVRVDDTEPEIYTIKYDLDENDGNSERTAYIHIKTSTIEVTATVRQMLDRITHVSLSPNTVVPAEGNDITIKAEVDDGGYFDSFVILAQDNHGEILGAGTMPSSGNGTSQTTVIPIPEYWSTPSHTVPTQRRIAFNYVGNTNSQWEMIGELTQDSYWINVACPVFTTGNGKIDEAGGDYEVAVWGKWSDDTIFRFWDETNRQVISEKVNLMAGSASDLTPSKFDLKITQNPSGMDRTVRLQYSVNGGNRWYNVGEERTQDWKYIYNFDVAGFSDIPRAGETYPIQLSGNWPDLVVHVLDVKNNRAVLQEVEISAGNGADNSHSIVIGANDSWEERLIEIEHTEDNWTTSEVYDVVGKQRGYSIDYGSLSPVGEIDPKGDEITVSLYGEFPDNGSGITVLAEGTGVSVQGTTIDGQVKLLIPNNDTGGDRTIKFSAFVGTRTAEPFEEVLQKQSNTIIHVDGYDVVIAHSNAEADNISNVMTWTDAMGISDEFMTRVHNKPIYSPTNRDVGCGAYKETGIDAEWRLPTVNELSQMALIRTELGMTQQVNAYWSSEDYRGAENQHYAYNMGCYNSNINGSFKTYQFFARCVRRK